jgi:hypothetical protein
VPAIRLVLIFTLALARSCGPSYAHVGPRVRAIDPFIVHALDEGRRRSATFRQLLDEIERSDLIAHIRSASLDAGVDGARHFVAAAGGARFVRISLRRGLPLDVLTALLGHG